MFNLKQQVSSKHFKVFLFESSSPQPLSEATLKEDKPKSVHRFLLDQNSVSFEEFVQKLKSKSIVTSAEFKLFYLDDQNDWVSLSDEEDWKILNSILSSETVIKIVCQNIVPKSENNTNPHCEFFKNFKWHGGRRGHCPFGNASTSQTNGSCPWARGDSGCRRGFGASGLEQFAPLIENVVGSLFNGQQTQGANPLLGDLDLSSLLNNFFPGSAQQDSKQNDNTPQQEKEPMQNNQPPQFSGLNDLIKNFCGNLNEKVNNGSLNVPHFGIVCDGCGKRNFTGSRWNCADCGDFDFCQECFETKANDHFDGFHSFSQVEPKAKSFLSDFVKKMEGNQSSTEPQKEAQPTQQNETEVQERTEQVLPEEKLDEELYPTLDSSVPVTTSQLLSSQLEQPNAPVEKETQPQPVIESSPVVEYAVEQQLLKDMGFVDEQANSRLLKKHNGNIQRVITDLL